ncbi:MAG TPA: class I SAM-dependent methyltransferase [Polyangiaceae bacterium]|jgi:SAM-dependent methyltransferase|nr:class I SAM-dependent methyltransferase [Polyangiaceae bacterium]
MPNESVLKTAAADWAGTRGEKWRAELTRMEAMLAPVDEPLLSALRLDAPLRIADVGCGGGGTAFAIQRRAPAGSVVHGFDLSPALVEAARERASAVQGGPTFEVLDVANAAPPRPPYDRLASRFGTMFFDDPPAAFKNLAAWLAPGGRLAFAVWGFPSDNTWITTVRDAVAEIVEVPRADLKAPNLFRYGDVSLLLALLRDAGLVELEVRDWQGALPMGGGLPAAEAAAFALNAFSAFADLLAAAGGDARSRAQRVLSERFAPHESDGAVRMIATVHIVTAARSA